ncbi:MAG: hypothetical protein U5L95_02090 [Candidatus Saccharibacteria bacterium]|nr:hypothetical protein [Candidatus Saccharibacteria bacterium]
MRILKKLVRGLGVLGCRLGLFGFAVATALLLTFGTPEPAKTAVEDSGAYDIPLHELFDFQPATPDETEEDAGLSPDDPHVREAIASAFPPDKKQNIVERMIDGTYVWLNGEAEYPDFTINLAAEKETIIQSLADNAFGRVNDLEPCSPQELRALQNEEFDPFTVPCKPPIDLAAEKQKFIDEYGQSEEFLPDTTLTGEDLFKEGERHDSTNSAQNLPSLFAVFTKLPWILGVLAAITGAGIVFLYDTRREGTRKLGKLFVGTTVSLVIAGIITHFTLNGLKTTLDPQNDRTLDGVVASVVDSLGKDLLLSGAIITLIYLVIGIVILFITRKKPERETPETSVENRESTDENTEHGQVPDPNSAAREDQSANKNRKPDREQ